MNREVIERPKMTTRTQGRWFSALWLALMAMPYAVVADEPTQHDAATVLDNLRKIKNGQIETYYFEARQKDETIGYAVVSLRASRLHGQAIYKYKNESSVKIGEKSRLTLVSNATLTDTFEPISVEIGGTAVTPKGVRSAPRLTIEVDNVENTISVVAPQPLVPKGEEPAPQVLPRPNGRFIYALDAIVHLIDFNKYKAFKLPEYIPQSGDVLELTYKVEEQPDGTMLVNTIRYDGEQDYKFWFDKDGKLERWGEPPFDLLLYRSSKETVDKLQAEYEKEQKAAPAAPNDD